MKVLILHPNDELKLIKLQEEILSSCKTGGKKIFKSFPLWCKLNAFEEKIFENLCAKSNKEISSEITSVTISSPCVSESVFLPLEISFSDGNKLSLKIDLLLFEDNKTEFENFILPEFFCKIKIFRIGDAIFEGNTYYLQDSVWRKIENEEK